MKQRCVTFIFLILITVFSAVFACKPEAKKTGEEDLSILAKDISSPGEIVSIETPNVEPITYTNTVSLADLSSRAKKQKFFDMILPSILISKHKLKLKRERVEKLMQRDDLNQTEKEYLAELRQEYRAPDNGGLLKKLQDHPISIVLAQAALESGWGSSRFFLEANNVFGVWSFDHTESRLQAGGSRGGQRIYLKKYDDLVSSIDDYFRTLARGPYQEFRKKRREIDNPLVLVEFLRQYSELRGEYVERLQSIILDNQLQRFDNYNLQQSSTG